MSKKRDTHKGNSHRRRRKRAPSLLTAWALLGLCASFGASCSRHRAPGPAETETAPLEPAAESAPLAARADGPNSQPAPSDVVESNLTTASAAPPPREPTTESTARANTTGATAAAASCPKYGAPVRLAAISDAKLGEISGITPASQEGSFWVHNDSGDGPNAYLVTSDGKLAATFALGPFPVTDVEDMARAPRPGGGAYLYLADIGDNLAGRRDGVTILRAQEPDVGAPPKLPVSVMRVTYPSGPLDAEAFLVDPRSGELVIVAKHPLLPAQVLSTKDFRPLARMRELGSITPDSSGQVIAFVTGAAASEDGNFALLRTYEAAYLFTRRADQTLGEALLGPACRIETAEEKQGEAISFTRAAPNARPGTPPPLVTVSEGSPTTIWLQTPE